MKKLLLACGCMLSFAGVAGAKATMSPYDDAVYLFRGGTNLNGNAYLDSGSQEFINLVRAADPSHASHKCTLAKTDAGFGKIEACSGQVVKPLSAQVLTNCPYFHMSQPFVTNEMVTVGGVEYPVGRLYANYLNLPGASIFGGVPSGVALTNYTFFVRFRQEGNVCTKQAENDLVQIGFDWNARTGVSISLSDNGTGIRSPKFYCGRKQIYAGDHKFRYGKWNEVVFSVATNRITIASCENLCDAAGHVTNNILKCTYVTNTDAGDNPAVPSNRRNIRFGGESASSSAVYTNGVSGWANNEVKAFRGDVQAMAFWTRALTSNEMYQVLSERRPTIAQVGLANGHSDEFTKTESTVDANGTHPENWNPVLNAANPTRAITFTIVDGEHDVAQYVRLRPLAGSPTATIRFTFDGTVVATQTVSPDHDALVCLKAALMTRGAHTLTLTRTDENGGDFTVDALCVHGSWRIGNSSDPGGYGGMSHETQYPFQYGLATGTPRTFPLTDGDMKHFARGLSTGGNGKHTIPFDVPADLLDVTRDATLKVCFANFEAGGVNGKILVNGTELGGGRMAFSGTKTFSVPTSLLKPKDNTLVVERVDGSNWVNLPRYSLSLGRLISGCLLIFR